MQYFFFIYIGKEQRTSNNVYVDTYIAHTEKNNESVNYSTHKIRLRLTCILSVSHIAIGHIIFLSKYNYFIIYSENRN